MNSDAALRAQTDPFTVGNRAIFDALIAWAPLDAIVRAGNRTSTVPRADGIDAERAAIVPKVPTNFPGFLVTQGGFLLLPGGKNSTTADLRQDYIIQWATDVLNVVGLNVVKWETFRALCAAGDTILDARHKGLPFIRTVDIRDAQEGAAIVIPDPSNQGTGGRAGWVATFAISVEMYFSKTTILSLV